VNGSGGRQNDARLPASAPTLRDGLLAAREDRADDPAAVHAFRRLAGAYGTPLYVYDREAIVGRFREFRDAFSPRFAKLKIHYALKANTNLAIVDLLHREGAGAEVVSLGEILTARRAGVAPKDILFTSSSKSPEEIAYAVENGVVLNMDSVDEMALAAARSASSGRTARVSFRINPGVDPHTLHQINTGIAESKFGLHLMNGLALEAYRRALTTPGLAVAGVHCHIGSQITETSGYAETARTMLVFVRELKEKLGLRLEFLDLGGGLGIPYRDGEAGMPAADLAAVLKPIWDAGVAALGYEPELWLEPGRYFVGPAGFLVTRVNSVKATPLKTFLNVDAGFNTLVRPAMYGAWHRARVVGRRGSETTVDVAGDVCETGDILAEGRVLPRAEAGDLVVFLDAGAYGFVMASGYNARPLPAEVLVDDDTATVIRRRGTLDDLFRDQILPGEPT